MACTPTQPRISPGLFLQASVQPLLADLLPLKDHVAVLDYRPLLHEVALADRRIRGDIRSRC
jgi:hypothetical protein